MLLKKLAVAFVVLAVLSVSSIARAQPEDKGMKAELEKFQGTWVLASAKLDGKKVAVDHVKQSKITFDGDKVEVYSPHQHKEVIIATITKLEVATQPNQMQWIRTSGPNAGVTMTGLYKFKNPSQYTICFHPAGTSVPTKIGSAAGSGYLVQTWKRVK